MPSEIPDRHLRSIRELGSRVFKVKPFRGLKLYPPLVDNSIIIAERKINTRQKEESVSDAEVKIFVNTQDAELWKLQRENTGLSMKQNSQSSTSHTYFNLILLINTFQI